MKIKSTTRLPEEGFSEIDGTFGIASNSVQEPHLNWSKEENEDLVMVSRLNIS